MPFEPSPAWQLWSACHFLAQSVCSVHEGFRSEFYRNQIPDQLNDLAEVTKATASKVDLSEDGAAWSYVQGFRQMVLGWVKEGMPDGPVLFHLAGAANLIKCKWHNEVHMARIPDPVLERAV